jgi:hypothetical protein
VDRLKAHGDPWRLSEPLAYVTGRGHSTPANKGAILKSVSDNDWEAKMPDASMSKMLHERLIAVVRLRDGIFGKYVKVRVLREVLEAVSERSLATLAERPSLAKHLN